MQGRNSTPKKRTIRGCRACIMFSRKYLRVVKKTNTLPSDIIVWCFIDFGYEFRVKTMQDYHGVREFIFTDASRHHFEVY